MIQTASVENYYTLLGVDNNASQSQIKKAYFAKIREFPNETHPVQFQLLSKAYKLLMDSDAKAKYDYDLKDNGSYNRLLNNAIEVMDKGQYNHSLNMLQNMDRSYPNDVTIQQNIAICYINLEQYEDAKRILLRLESNHPNNEMVFDLLGQTYLN